MRKIWVAAIIGSLVIVGGSVVVFNHWTSTLPVTDNPLPGFRVIKETSQLAYDKATTPYPRAAQIHLLAKSDVRGPQHDLGALTAEQKALIDKDFYKETRFMRVRKWQPGEIPAVDNTLYELRYFDDKGRQIGSIELSYCVPYAGYSPRVKGLRADFPAIEKIMNEHGVVVDPHCGTTYDVHPPV